MMGLKNPHRHRVDGGKRKELLTERIVTQLLMAKYLQPFLKTIWLFPSPPQPFPLSLSASALVVRLPL
ncbi:MAG: hypothetical protein C0610_13440 [Desulfobacteraceae bacterium]|nr:MAG: hypothetical protein C0610_13440 [Desulfobacteraceae bacterium]